MPNQHKYKISAIRLPDEYHIMIAEGAKNRGITKTELIRQAILNYLKPTLETPSLHVDTPIINCVKQRSALFKVTGNKNEL